jgi:Fe-Mn family superoxide dismutase
MIMVINNSLTCLSTTELFVINIFIYLNFLVVNIIEGLSLHMKMSQIKESKEKLMLVDLPYKQDDLSPILSSKNIKYHYDTLSRGYVDKFNKNEGDAAFNKAGAFLHNIWWPQLQKPKQNNKPTGSSLTFIEKHFEDFYQFKTDFITKALEIQGSGWTYLNIAGKIKNIANHEIKNDIILIIDMWEHSYFLDYPADKKSYLRDIWQCINWNVISDRVNLKY